MKTLKHCAAIVLCAFTMLYLSACTNLQNNSQSAAQASKPQYLFVLHSEDGNLVKGADNKMYLVLHDPKIFAFTDRPYRKSEHIDIQQFSSMWQKKLYDNFMSDNPNAALAGVDYTAGPNSKELSQLVVLNSMTYDPVSSNVYFKVADLDKSGEALNASKFHHAVLFVDGFQDGGTGFFSG